MQGIQNLLFLQPGITTLTLCILPAPVINSLEHAVEGRRYTQGGAGDSADEQYASDEEEDSEQRFYREDFAEQSWNKEHSDGCENADWKRPDMHMFKASSYKGSVTSEKSSRLDPHTYQSYAAGLLYSSGRSERFLKLQKHFAVLERIGELDKSSSLNKTAADWQTSRSWQELGTSGQTFHSQEELQELYSELKEAKKKKEFFHDTDKREEIVWTPEKDFGLKKREHTLRDQVRTYRNLVEDTSSKPSLASRPDSMKRAVSFGELYDKFHTSESTDPHREPSRNGARNHRDELKQHGATAAGLQAAQPPHSKETRSPGGVTIKQSTSSPGSMSYLQLMENAARKSRQRAIHGTHLDSPCNEYEAYVKELKKINKEESDHSNINFHQSSLKPPSRQPCPAPQLSQKACGKEKTLCTDESFDVLRDNRNMPGAGPEIVIDSSSTPKPGLKVKLGQADDTQLTSLSSTAGPAVRHGSKQDNSSGPESKQPRDYLDRDSTRTAHSETRLDRPGYSKTSLERPGYSETSLERPGYSETSLERPGYSETTLERPGYSETSLERHRYSETSLERSMYSKTSLERPGSHETETSLEMPVYSKTYTERSRNSETRIERPVYSKTSPEYSETSLEECLYSKSSLQKPGNHETNLEKPVYSKTSLGRPGNSDRSLERPGHSETSLERHAYAVERPWNSELRQERHVFSNTSLERSGNHEMSQERAVYSEMPDIIQMEKHHKPSKSSTTKSESSRTTLPEPVKSISQTRSPSACQAHTNIGRDDTREHYSQENQNQKPGYTEQRHPQPTAGLNAPSSNHPSTSEKGAVFQVRDLRNLAENNEFSISQLSWMKKPHSNCANREAGYRNSEQEAFSYKPYETTRKWRDPVDNQQFSAKIDPSASFVSQDSYPSAQQAHGISTRPFESGDRVAGAGKKSLYSPAKPESLSFQPTPSQSGPTFSATRRGTESRPRPTESSRFSSVASDSTPPHSRYSPNVTARYKQPDVSGPDKGTTLTETGGAWTLKKGTTTYPPAEAAGQRFEPEVKDTATSHGPGEGGHPPSQSPDKHYGQLRKWTAVADIYRDVEKSWSPTRETKPFPLENNSSISSTDTFIVKDTDGEQDDLESSMSSVSRLRQIFERQQQQPKVSKSRSEPDMSQDSDGEPRRPRSAKSQVDISAITRDQESPPHPGITRTVSGDLREIRHHYQDGPDHSANRQTLGFQPDTATGYSRPTDVALRAWVHYTEKPRYDPYLPPEDILKEVSAASTGRKLDIPRQKIHRPSSVSRMTLEYFNQIGSEWQHSGNKGYVPQNSVSGQVPDCWPTHSGIQYVDRRYVTHQYVNEEQPFTSDYPQTDDVKLKQSQWAGAAGFVRASEQQFPQRTLRNADARPEYSALGLEGEPAKSKPSEQLDRQARLQSGTITMKQPSFQPVSTDLRPAQTAAPVPAQRSRPQPWRPQTASPEPRSQPLSQSAVSLPADLPSHTNTPPTSQPPAVSSGHSVGHAALNTGREERNQQKRSTTEGSSLQPQMMRSRTFPPEPSRMPPLAPVSPKQQQQQQPKPLPRGVQHTYSKSSDSEHSSSGDYGAVYCVSTGSVLYGVEADEGNSFCSKLLLRSCF
ncbi:uncharacterized protein LOC143293101 [Babylonia areolata]|uniref:uncharacterized protein LOC143293101 n=1 Tax=Babylonia areolata TaxID=304850 RepID=UPI003FCEF40E